MLALLHLGQARILPAHTATRSGTCDSDECVAASAVVREVCERVRLLAVLAASALRATATEHASNSRCVKWLLPLSLAGITQEEASRGYPPAKDKFLCAGGFARSLHALPTVARRRVLKSRVARGRRRSLAVVAFFRGATN